MKEITSFILSPEFKGIFAVLRIVLVAFSLVFAIGIIFLVSSASWLKRRTLESLTEFFTYHPYGVRKSYKRWLRISRRLGAGREAEYKLSIIEADSFLDEILKRMGYSGETMGDRLKKIDPAILPNIEEVWEARKARNNIVHDPDYRLSLDEAQRVIAIYEKALRSLEMF